jgi:metal-dependent amidase/aminoacylase/carboxypeptidase family protein
MFEANNVVPDICEIQGTVRAFTPNGLDLIERRMRQIVEATCGAFEATCEFEFRRICAPTINPPQETEFARRVLAEMVGEQNVLEFEPTTGAVDFSYYLLEGAGCYFVIGNGEQGANNAEAGPCLLHSPFYNFSDELIPLGEAM